MGAQVGGQGRQLGQHFDPDTHDVLGFDVVVYPPGLEHADVAEGPQAFGDEARRRAQGLGRKSANQCGVDPTG